MNRLAVIFTMVVLGAWVQQAPADGIFGLFGTKPKAQSAERVRDLTIMLTRNKSEGYDRLRSAAVLELGAYDTAAYPEIVPLLLDVMQHDKSSLVRIDAATSLSNFRPISVQIGQALEKAQNDDPYWRTRIHAKSVLANYRKAGYAPNSITPDANIATGSKTGPIIQTKGN